MSPTEGLKAIAGLIPMKLHLHKLASRSQLCSTALPENHLIKTLMDDPLNMLWDAWDRNNFYFLFLLFSDFIGIFFSFSFLLDDEEARDIAVT